jgi:condensin complex subunit 1
MRVVFARPSSPPSSRPVSRDETQSAPSPASTAAETAVDNPAALSSQPPSSSQLPSSSQPPSSPTKKQNKDNTVGLSQLLFIVGHVAVKQIVHLELCELDFKRRKQEKEKTAAATARSSLGASTSSRRSASASHAKDKSKVDDEGDELDLIGGTTEDDFTEAMAHIRERELLYGPTSLLAHFGPLVSEICANNTTYRDRNLQQAATLCLAKLMCVSSEYCEANLPLLITIMERSADATVRSNAVIALGDMAVCFNHLIDENTDFLYRRLADPEPMVKRTCLMTLTFLILAGQVKVKGQLGEMAKCLEDEDKKIADLARMFFSELSTKDNAVYNHFVDMFSLLSADKRIEEESFRRIVRFLLGFVEKVSLFGVLLRFLWVGDANYNCHRTNTPSSWLINWLPDWQGAITSGSGAMSRSRWACCSTRMRTLRSSCRRASRWCRRLRRFVGSVWGGRWDALQGRRLEWGLGAGLGWAGLGCLGKF